MEIKVLGRYRDQAGMACRAGARDQGDASKTRGVARLDRINTAGTLSRADAKFPLALFGSHETLRWRKVDSNPRSPVRKIYANTEIAAAREQRGRRSAGE